MRRRSIDKTRETEAPDRGEGPPSASHRILSIAFISIRPTMSPGHPSEVYSQQLFKLAYGYPLWEPEPKEGQGEVEIGDVGYLRQGGFYRLFNAMRDAEDDIQHVGVPEDFQRHDPGRLQPVKATNTINAGPLFSSTVRHIKVEGDIGA